MLILQEAWENMTEEPNKQEMPPPEKLLIDDPSNFQFHVAYLVYSELFDKATETEVKIELNSNIEVLRQNQISYETFYRNIARHRRIDPTQRQDKFSLQTQRKRDWRMKSQKQERIKRHKK
jgi:hypothetical protein